MIDASHQEGQMHDAPNSQQSIVLPVAWLGLCFTVIAAAIVGLMLWNPPNPVEGDRVGTVLRQAAPFFSALMAGVSVFVAIKTLITIVRKTAPSPSVRQAVLRISAGFPSKAPSVVIVMFSTHLLLSLVVVILAGLGNQNPPGDNLTLLHGLVVPFAGLGMMTSIIAQRLYIRSWSLIVRDAGEAM